MEEPVLTSPAPPSWRGWSRRCSSCPRSGPGRRADRCLRGRRGADPQRPRSARRGSRAGAPRARPARDRRRLGAGDRPGRRACRPTAARPAEDAAADAGAGRDARDRRLPAAGLAAGDRPDPRRQLGVGRGRRSAERGLIEESGRSRFGAVIYRTTELFERLFGLSGLEDLPDVAEVRPDARGRGRAARAPAARPASSALLPRPPRSARQGCLCGSPTTSPIAASRRGGPPRS